MGTYRPVEVIVSNHSLKSVKQELQLHEQCVELPLSFLMEEHVAKYLVRRFASPSPASAGKPVLSVVEGGQGKGLASAALHKLAHLIHQRIEGNPLFMVNLVDYLVTQGVLARINGQWRLQGEVTAVESWAPESLQQMIEKQIERLSPQDRRVLEVASVAGEEFSAAAVAAGAGIEVEAVEEYCGELTRHEQFLRARGTADWPDGTVAARYGFLHALYQDVLYGQLTARRRRLLHQQIGERVEQAYGERAREIAAELALHFERGRDYHRAVRYLQQAGENAVRRSAHHEAVALLVKGLELLKTLPDTLERAQQELALQITLGAPLIATKGYGAPEVGKVYTRARELCRQVGKTPQLWQVLNGLRVFYNAQGELQMASELAEQIMRLAQSEQNPALLMVGHLVLGEVPYCSGEWAPARGHFERAIALYDTRQPRPSLAWVDAKVPSLSFAALALWMLGYPDQAFKRSQGALTPAQELSHPFSLAFALQWAAVLHMNRREVQATQKSRPRR
jgi:tetratricopeptide (TPR) repeat protein